MAQTYLKGAQPTVHRIDLPCEQTGFTTPPFDVHLKFLAPSTGSGTWTLLAHAAAGKPDALAGWLGLHAGIEGVKIGPGLAPKLFRASAAMLPPAWAKVASFATVHHLDLAADGHASWFIEGIRDQVWALVQHLEIVQQAPMVANSVRCRPVNGGTMRAPISRRQFEALSTAVALGYYEIPHRIDLRMLAARTGVSLGSVSELLRRAEGAILTHYVDSSLMLWPVTQDEVPNPFVPVTNLLRPDVVREAVRASWPANPARSSPYQAVPR